MEKQEIIEAIKALTQVLAITQNGDETLYKETIEKLRELIKLL